MKLKRGDLNIDMEGNLTAKVGKNRWSVNTQTCTIHHWRVISVISMEQLWKRPWYKTIIGTWDMWANLTAWRTLNLLADGLQNGQMRYSSIFWTLPFSTAVSFSPLVLQIIASTFHTDIGDGPKQEAGRVPWPQTTRHRRQTPSTSKLKRLDSRNNRHWLMQCKRIWYCVCSAKNETRTKYKCWVGNIGLRATPRFEVHHTKLYYWEPSDTEIEKLL